MVALKANGEWSVQMDVWNAETIPPPIQYSED